MSQTFYIESDEEIISVIGRLRKSSSQENFFVFPKRALVLQSIVNLRLFQREAEKLGKKIIVVTQDEAGKKLAEKAGVETESYSDDFNAKNSHVEISNPNDEKAKAVQPAVSNIPRSQDIGSMDFYSSQAEPRISSPAVANEPTGTNLRIRNITPPKQTSLNSLKTEEKPLPIPPRPMFNPTVSLERKPESIPVAPVVESTPNFSPAPRPMPAPQGGSREERLKNFFAPTSSSQPTRQNVETISRPIAPQVRKEPATVTKKASHVFLILGGVSLLSLLGVGIFLFLPKAEVHVVPRKVMKSIDKQFDGRTTGETSESLIPIRVIEKDQGVKLTLEASGTSQGSAQKSRGNVVISNEYSADSQTLVATTRFESTDGKVFRLIEGVTVPGMSNGKPGTITASVIADQAGSEYNIPPTTFTIPGFKGSPKYSKFSAKSTQSMNGGGDANGSDITVISKTDLDNAEMKAKEKAKADYLDSLEGDLKPGEKVLEEAIEIVSNNQASLPVAGTAATSFDYENSYKIRAFVFREDIVKQRIEQDLDGTLSGIPFHPVLTVLSYGESLPNYTEGTLRLKAHASVSLESDIESDSLKDELLGKNEEEINEVLSNHPEINKIQINIEPRFISSALPRSKERVTLIVEPGEE